MKTCADNGVKEIVEVKIGYDGIVLANSKSAAPLQLTRKDIYPGACQRCARSGQSREDNCQSL